MTENEAIDVIKKKALERLDGWKSQRQREFNEENGPLYDIADTLSCIVYDSIDIDNPLIPEIIGVLSAVVVGITGGESVMNEVEMILNMARDYNVQKSKQH